MQSSSSCRHFGTVLVVFFLAWYIVFVLMMMLRPSLFNHVMLRGNEVIDSLRGVTSKLREDARMPTVQYWSPPTESKYYFPSNADETNAHDDPGLLTGGVTLDHSQGLLKPTEPTESIRTDSQNKKHTFSQTLSLNLSETDTVKDKVLK